MEQGEAARRQEQQQSQAELDVSPERPVDLLRPPEPLQLQVGVGLIDLADPKNDRELLNRIRTLRRDLTVNMGFPVPLIHTRDNLRLATDDDCVGVRGVVRGKGTLFSDQFLTLATRRGGPKRAGVETVDPTFNLPAYWID